MKNYDYSIDDNWIVWTIIVLCDDGDDDDDDDQGVQNILQIIRLSILLMFSHFVNSFKHKIWIQRVEVNLL